jgi:hypothetical protein
MLTPNIVLSILCIEFSLLLQYKHITQRMCYDK